MEFTNLEKRALVRIIGDIASVDGRIDFGEVLYFSHMKEDLNILDIDIDESNRMSVLQCLFIIRELNKEKKQFIAIMMLEMIEADGDIDKKEMELFYTFCAVANIPLPEINI